MFKGRSIRLNFYLLGQIKKNFIIIFVVLFLAAGAISLLDKQRVEPEVIGIGALVKGINDEAVKSIEVRGDILLITLLEEAAKPQELKKEFNQSFSQLIENYEIAPEKLQKIDIQVKEETGWKFWLKVLAPYLLRHYIFYDASGPGCQQ